MSDKNQVVVGAKKKQDIFLRLFLLYVTPLCVYLQSLFIATTNAWGAIYITLLVGVMLISGRFSIQVKKSDALFFGFMLIACFASFRAGEYLYFMQAFFLMMFVWGYTKYDLEVFYQYLDIIFVFGVACAIACFIQELWNGFYTDFISKLFKAEEVDTILRLEEDNGNCGLMPQTANAAGCILNAFLILCLKNNNSRKKIIFGLILTLGLILTGKRAHLFMGAFVFFTSFFVGFEGSRGVKKIVVGMVSSAILFIGLYMLVPILPQESSIVTGIDTIQNFDVEDDDIMHGREFLYAEAIVMGNSAPLTGHGWGSFRNTVSYRGDSTDTHNIYLQLYAEQGIIVLSIFIIAVIVLIGANVRMLKKLRRHYAEHSREVRLARLSFCFILFFCLYGMTGNGLYNIECLIILGVGVSIFKRVKQVAKV